MDTQRAAFMFAAVCWASAAMAGGGHELLLVVNPADENALRVASVYQQLRQVPDCNIVAIEPPVLRRRHVVQLTQRQFAELYARPIEKHIADHGLTGQIRFIGMVGQPWRVHHPGATISMTQAVMEIPQIAADENYAGYTTGSALFDVPALGADEPIQAIRRDRSYTIDVTAPPRHYYVGGLIGYTGPLGMTADQAIAGLRRTAAADGTKLSGTIYFEANGDIRSTMREAQWPQAKAILDRLGVPWVENRNTPGSTPRDRTDVRGAVVGRASLELPNGSIYLPGAWADHVTSFGGDFETIGHTKAVEWLKLGVAATSGTVAEPRANPQRFPHTTIHGFVALGLTHGESFAKSVHSPVLLQFFGDLLARPYANLPTVTLPQGPQEQAVVAGPIELMATTLVAPGRPARAIRQQELYIDGKLLQAHPGDTANFQVDTTRLSDGWHELRIVGISDDSIASAHTLVRHIVVSNNGRSISVAERHIVVEAAAVDVPVHVKAGDSQVTTVELRHLGRNVATYDATRQMVRLDATRLAFGPDNVLTPVAVFADGTHTRGQPLRVERRPQLLPGQAPTPPPSRVAGARVSYFYGAGRASLDEVDFIHPPGRVIQAPAINLSTPQTEDGQKRSFLPHSPTPHPTDAVDQMALVVEASFVVDEQAAGEHLFWLYRTNDAARLQIDGLEVLHYDGSRHGGSWSGLGGIDEQSVKLFLAPGRHDVRLDACNMVEPEGRFRDYFDVSLWCRGPDGVTRLMDDSMLFAPAHDNPHE